MNAMWWKRLFGRGRQAIPQKMQPPVANAASAVRRAQVKNTRGELIIGIDFAGPATASSQRKKIIALAATRDGARTYRVEPGGFNSRILTQTKPGWTADELSETLIREANNIKVVAFDFPFSIPKPLLDDRLFAAKVGRASPFRDWRAFNTFVGERLDLQPPLDFSVFDGWRSKEFWKKRSTDVIATAQPPLKDKFQVLFNMTLLGNALLSKISGHYRIVPFDRQSDIGEVIEVYPGLTMRDLGRPDYKRNPVAAIDSVLSFSAMHGVVVNIDPVIRHFCETYDTGSGSTMDPDGSDALIALVMAILYRENLATKAILDSRDETQTSEGVIWRPAG